jgi:hypothetical protein
MPEELPIEATLTQMEEEVLAEGREWMRQRLEQKLQQQADRIGQSFSPPGGAAGPAAKKKTHAAKQHRNR